MTMNGIATADPACLKNRQARQFPPAAELVGDDVFRSSRMIATLAGRELTATAGPGDRSSDSASTADETA